MSSSGVVAVDHSTRSQARSLSLSPSNSTNSADLQSPPKLKVQIHWWNHSPHISRALSINFPFFSSHPWLAQVFREFAFFPSGKKAGEGHRSVFVYITYMVLNTASTPLSFCFYFVEMSRFELYWGEKAPSLALGTCNYKANKNRQLLEWPRLRAKQK